MHVQYFIIIALGGASGTIFRYGCSLLLSRTPSSHSQRECDWLDPHWRLVLKQPWVTTRGNHPEYLF